MTLPSLADAPLVDPADLVPPGERELHVWCWGSEIDPSPAQLNLAERAHYQRLTPPAARAQYLAAHAGLQRILARYLGVRPGEVDWQTGPRGKPCDEHTHLNFNLSHSGEWTLLAVSGQEVGIDIERVRPVASQRALAERYFSAVEQQQMIALPEDPARDLFFRLWARKEACLKLVGTGLQGGLAEVEVLEVAPGGSTIALGHLPEWPAGECWLGDLTGIEDYAAAVACADRPLSIACFRLP